jgi:UDPglucose 6-dehydrogenase
MRIAVYGLWHLGCVTAACLASLGHQVLACDPDHQVIQQLIDGKTPIVEPGLTELIEQGRHRTLLSFTSKIETLHHAGIIWVTFDTPVNEQDQADSGFVIGQIHAIFPFIKQHAVILISSQLPIGSTALLSKMYHEQYPKRRVYFAYSPENLRLGQAIDAFMMPHRIIVGVLESAAKQTLTPLFDSIHARIIWMLVESAEMTKHALNAFLASSVVFINEVAVLCEKTGANAREVEQGLKSDIRIGSKAYLRPGGAFAGGTLARDVSFLNQLSQWYQTPAQLLNAVMASNDAHKKWVYDQLSNLFSNLNGKRIVLLGLTYKAGTNTLRRSSAVELIQWLQQQDAIVHAYDPAIAELPEMLSTVRLFSNLHDSLKNIDAAVITCYKPEFNTIDKETFIRVANETILIDADAKMESIFYHDNRFQYYSVGRHKCC